MVEKSCSRVTGGEGRGEGALMARQEPHLTANARALRARQTQAESLLWQVLRGRRLNGLKFRRQHPIAPYIADFACVEQQFIVEVDGGYHDPIYEQDQTRQKHLEAAGWRVMRIRNEDVLEDVESVAVGIRRFLGLPTEA